jgi:ArsR family transcriptional regulator, arsenate/arsenite/antimonite-responsive transcriptional repressor
VEQTYHYEGDKKGQRRFREARRAWGARQPLAHYISSKRRRFVGDYLGLQFMAKSSSGAGINRMFRAFSDRTRLRILHLLLDGELCVGDIATVLRLAQPAASRHLAYLRKAGLVVMRKAGLWSYYSLAPAHSDFHKKLVECLGTCFEQVTELRRDAARAAHLKKTGGCCDQPASPEPGQRQFENRF